MDRLSAHQALPCGRRECPGRANGDDLGGREARLPRGYGPAILSALASDPMGVRRDEHRPREQTEADESSPGSSKVTAADATPHAGT